MGFQVRCNCGWSGQVSEFYLDKSISCPDCGADLAVRRHSGIPYGYAPYDTWRKRPKPVVEPVLEVLPPPARRGVRMPAPRLFTYRVVEDRHGPVAFWLGLGSVLLALTVCGLFPAAILAVFAIRSAVRSRRFCNEYGLQHSASARVGAIMAAMSLLISTSLFFGGFLNRPEHYEPATHDSFFSEPQEPHQIRTDDAWRSDTRWRNEIERLRHIDQRPSPAESYGSGDWKPQPLAPRDDFERKQVDYSNRIREQRRKAKAQKAQSIQPEAVHHCGD